MSVEFDIAKVIDNKDELNQGKVVVTLSKLDPTRYVTAKPVFPFLGNMEINSPWNKSGSFYPPPVGSYVLVIYDPSSFSEVYYLGGVLPVQNEAPMPECEDPESEKRYIIARTASVQKIVVSDAKVDQGILLHSKNSKGTSFIKLDANTGDIIIQSSNDIILKTDGVSIRLTKNGQLEINASNQYTLNCPNTVENTKATRSMCMCGGACSCCC